MNTCFTKLLEMEKTNNSQDSLGPPQLLHLAESLDLDCDDIAIYAIAWKCESSNPRHISRKEWLNGMKDYKDVEDLKLNIPALRNSVKPPKQFARFYEWAFLWSRDSPNMDFLTYEEAADLWGVILPQQEPQWPYVSHWCEFVSKGGVGERVSRDLWNLLLQFSSDSAAFDDHDPDDGWHTSIDKFMEWLKHDAVMSS
eukprot:Tbor_TRINITY_DN5777_c1_g5::TRINITY_DN5777_c1_g5_i1::g.20412::m.20412/K17822/DCUN1D1_2; DCN1-like protein 1/2